jgi:hypothetical protein
MLRPLSLSIALCKRLAVHRTITSQAPLLEELTLKHFKYGLYYPVYIGETLNSRYKVEVKLGYGGYSTVWLCTDEKCALATFHAYF